MYSSVLERRNLTTPVVSSFKLDSSGGHFKYNVHRLIALHKFFAECAVAVTNSDDDDEWFELNFLRKLPH